MRSLTSCLPTSTRTLARAVNDMTPHPQQLRDNPDKRKEVNVQTAALLASIDSMLND